MPKYLRFARALAMVTGASAGIAVGATVFTASAAGCGSCGGICSHFIHQTGGAGGGGVGGDGVGHGGAGSGDDTAGRTGAGSIGSEGGVGGEPRTRPSRSGT